MSCPYYKSSPGYYGYCAAKAEMERRSKNRRVVYESEGYLDWESWHEYDCSAGNQNHKYCPRYQAAK